MVQVVSAGFRCFLVIPHFSKYVKKFRKHKTYSRFLIFHYFRTVIVLHFRSVRFSYLLLSKRKKRFLAFHNQEFKHVFEQKDLGTILDTDLQFYEYSTTKIKKANVMVSLTWRSLSYLDGRIS